MQFLGETPDYAEAFDPPVPARELVPEWYKRMPNYCTPEREVGEYGHFNSTVKHCMPALDAITAGYILTLPQDLHVVHNEGYEVSTSWPVDNMTLIEHHGSAQISEFALSEHWAPVALKLINRWVVKTPPGYSTLFIPPMWRDDHRFQVFPGLVDTDRYPQPINFPFLLKRGYTGTIENGTPFVQLIPIKREEWRSEVGIRTEDMRLDWLRVTRQSIYRYKQHFRSPKRWL